jgi:hypothetical protein
MHQRAGRTRTKLELLRQSRTATIRSLDRITRMHVEEMTKRQVKIASLTAEIQTLEKAETE